MENPQPEGTGSRGEDHVNHAEFVQGPQTLSGMEDRIRE